MSMTLTISARELNPSVEYIKPISKFNFDTSINFIQENTTPEVNQTDFKKKLIKITSLTSISTLGLATPVFAQTTQSQILNSEVVQIFKYLELGAAAVGLGLSILLLQAAGIFRMFPKKKREAMEWTDDILKGLLQLVVAPILVMTITLTAYFLFGNSEWFIKPF